MLSVKELKSSSKKELHSELERAREEAIKIRIGLKTKHIKNLSLMGKQKRYIAQISTALNELDREESKKSPQKAK